MLKVLKIQGFKKQENLSTAFYAAILAAAIIFSFYTSPSKTAAAQASLPCARCSYFTDPVAGGQFPQLPPASRRQIFIKNLNHEGGEGARRFENKNHRGVEITAIKSKESWIVKDVDQRAMLNVIAKPATGATFVNITKFVPADEMCGGQGINSAAKNRELFQTLPRRNVSNPRTFLNHQSRSLMILSGRGRRSVCSCASTAVAACVFVNGIYFKGSSK